MPSVGIQHHGSSSQGWSSPRRPIPLPTPRRSHLSQHNRDPKYRIGCEALNRRTLAMSERVKQATIPSCRPGYPVSGTDEFSRDARSVSRQANATTSSPPLDEPQHRTQSPHPAPQHLGQGKVFATQTGPTADPTPLASQPASNPDPGVWQVQNWVRGT
jgi:hypothetical protein